MSDTFASVDDMLAAARAGLDRVTAEQADLEVRAGKALIVDIRPVWQRARDGEILGSLVVERNHLEWRLHPDSDARVEVARHGQRWLVICAEGYTSSLAAASLRSFGIDATDVIGGIEAWAGAGLPLWDGPTPPDAIVGDGPLFTL
jgi:rhodanese-related sulfurtransferase